MAKTRKGQSRSDANTVWPKAALSLILSAGLLMLFYHFRIYVYLRGFMAHLDKTAISASEACAAGTVQSRLVLPDKRLNGYSKGEYSQAVVNWADCIRTTSVPVFWFVDLDGQGRGFIKQARHLAKIVSIRRIEPAQGTEQIVKSIGFQSQFDFNIFSEGMKRVVGPSRAILIDFLLNRDVVSVSARAVPADLTFAKTVNSEKVEELLSTGANLIDTRNQTLFAKHHHQKAKNVYYKMNVLGLRVPFADFLTHDDFKVSELPDNKGLPLIIMGESEFDITPMRALLIAYHGGWQNLYWYRTGELGRIKSPLTTEKTYPQIITISLKEASSFIKIKKLDVIDTRSNAAFSFGRLPSAKNLFYAERSNAKRQTASMNLAQFKAENDWFLIPPGLDGESFLVYGADEQDFAALKAALWLREASRKPTYWLRDGFLGWKNARLPVER